MGDRSVANSIVRSDHLRVFEAVVSGGATASVLDAYASHDVGAAPIVAMRSRRREAQLCRHFSVVGLEPAIQRRIEDALRAEGLVCRPSLYSETVVTDTIAIRREATPPQSE